MNDFKIGDYVTYIGASGLAFTNGEIYQIKGIKNKSVLTFDMRGDIGLYLTNVPACLFVKGDFSIKHTKVPIKTSVVPVRFSGMDPGIPVLSTSKSFIDFSGMYGTEGDYDPSTTWQTEITKVEKKCECGIHKTYGKDCQNDYHSSWCPVREKK